MAQIKFEQLRHSYRQAPHLSDEDFVLKELNLTFQDGSAYALLGPSGCGKTTLLNITSGLITPTQGRIFFGEQDVTTLSPDERNIAQVFQFPVVYDTMTVRQNLEFPLKNRNMSPQDVEEQVRRVAEILGLDSVLDKRAARLGADSKQKISLGRGLVRSDVNVIMFDEPLTVIDPHLKWELRSKLKELHREFNFTMIYVTHDQTEALTFADQVVVMHSGQVVQIGSPEELFKHPQHTFVGHFIGSPGMNFLPCELSSEGMPIFCQNLIPISEPYQKIDNPKDLQLGIRPEFIEITPEGFPVNLVSIKDIGRYQILTVSHEHHEFKIYLSEELAVDSGNLKVRFHPDYTHVYHNGWLCQKVAP